jgi:hypothetical protein
MTYQCCYNEKKIKNFFWGREDDNKRRQENGQNLILFFIYFPNYQFWAYITMSTHSLLGAWSFHLVYSRFAPSGGGGKGFVKWFF